MKYEKSCGAVVFDGEQVLVVKHQIGHYDFPKGHMEAGEKEEETAIREVKEETNIDIALTEKRYVVTYYPSDKVKKDVVFFVAKKIGGSDHAQKGEIELVKWVPLKEVSALLTFDSAKDLFHQILLDLDK